MIKTFEWWLVENSGYSRGTSWFDDGLRYTTFEDAKMRAVQMKISTNGLDIEYRVTRVKTEYEYETI